MTLGDWKIIKGKGECQGICLEIESESHDPCEFLLTLLGKFIYDSKHTMFEEIGA